MKKKILIIGGAGYIGSNIIPFLGKHDVFIYDRNRYSSPNSICGSIIGEAGDSILLDSYIQKIQPDFIFYSISIFSTRCNNEIAKNIIGSLMKSIPNHTLVINLGSSSVYGIMEGNRKLVEESDRVSPVSDYGKYKLFEEELFRIYMKEFGKGVIFTRVFNVIGPKEPIRMVAGSFVRRLTDNKNKIEVGNIQSARDFIDIRDLGAALAKIAFHGKSGDIYNICSGRSITINKLLEKIIDNMQINPDVITDMDRFKKNDIPCLVGNNKKIKKIIKWEPAIKLEKSIKDLIRSVENE